MTAATAFEMQIVDHQRAPAVIELGDNCDSSAQPPLKQGDVGHVGSRLPESRLGLKVDHTDIAHRQPGENRLALKRGTLAISLAELLPGERQGVAHLEALGELLGDVDVAAAMRVEIDLLKQA